MTCSMPRRNSLNCLSALALVVFLASCSGSTPVSSDLPDSGPSDATCNPDSARNPDASDIFTHRVIRHEHDALLSGIATGEFAVPSLSYEPIPVDARYRHSLAFHMTPLLPPLLRHSLDTADAVEPFPSFGPIVLFSDDMDVLVFSPMDNFFSSVVDFRDGALVSGVAGEIDTIPAGTVHRFLVVEGRGMGATIQHWGEVLRQDRGIQERDRYADVGVSTLGYWTDNGAAYYYATAPGMNEEDTLLAVKADADQRGIPYGYFQIDSWWYFKERTGRINPGGLVRWEARPEMFPDGIGAFQKRLGLPLVAHNRWFATDNSYRTDDSWVDGKGMSFPTDPRSLFDQFMQDAVDWGIVTYEQDWLDNQFWGIPWLRQDLGRADRWMYDLDQSAGDHGLTVQLCMANAAHLMSMVDMPSVTSIRTSIDYTPSVAKECFWPQFHVVNMLAWALGVPPFKDNFHSSEDFGEAEALISVLSAGMVGVGDEIGLADPVLLLNTCRSDGVLLKPDHPAAPLDKMFLPHERPLLVATGSDHPCVGQWTYLASFHLARLHPQRDEADELFSLFAYDGEDPGTMFVWPDTINDWTVDLATELGITEPVVAYDWRSGDARVVDGPILELPPLDDLYDHGLVVLAPILSNGIALLGETGKFVTMSDRRFGDIEVQRNAVLVTLEGVPGEIVAIEAYDARNLRKLIPAVVEFDEQGRAQASLAR